MTLIEDIQNAAVDSDSDLGSLLRRCKILAAKLGSKPLGDWLIWESNGYPREAELPAYRTWDLTIKGHFSGPFGSGIRNATIPSVCLPENIRKSVTEFECRESVAALEVMVASNDGGMLRITADNLTVVLGQSVIQNQNCIESWGEFSAGHVVEILNAVRNKVLDFVLAVGRECPDVPELPADDGGINSERVNQIFNTTVYGGSLSFIGSAIESDVQLVIRSNDLSSLESALKELGASEEDLIALKDALKSDPKPTTYGQFGPKVAAWIGQAVGKAASGAWKVGAGVAGNVLSKAVASYYGLSE